MFWMCEGCFRICTRMCVLAVTAHVPLHNSFCFYSFRLCWVYKRSTLMNNEAITTTANHRAPPARSPLLHQAWASPPTAASSCWRNAGFSLFALLNKFSGELLFVSVYNCNVQCALNCKSDLWFNFHFYFLSIMFLFQCYFYMLLVLMLLWKHFC